MIKNQTNESKSNEELKGLILLEAKEASMPIHLSIATDGTPLFLCIINAKKIKTHSNSALNSVIHKISIKRQDLKNPIANCRHGRNAL